MSQDWIEAAAKEISESTEDECTYLSGSPMLGWEFVADILRRHFPPQPQWRERPTCAGLWTWARFASQSGDCIIEGGFCVADETYFSGPDVRWYGPIPSPPQEPTHD